ncbi:MAG: penicillin-binding protein, partial [Acidobacteria bacterium]
SGIEREYDDQLHGKPGEMLISVDARKKWFGRVEKEPEPGQNVVLTIDENIQYIAERELKQAIQETHALAGTLIVENPRTGEILALANWPTFDPNIRKQITPDALKNRAVSDVYEPGSTFKVVTVSAALEEKLTRPNEIFDCQMGSIVINGMRIRDHKPFGLLPVSGIIANSSDVGAIKIALRLGEDRFYKYIRAFGFGQQTGIELPGETRGLAKPVNRWSKVSIGAISMGQEIGISPLQLVGMVSTIANDGAWVAPRIVAASTQPQSGPQTVVFHPASERRVVSTITAAEMKEMLQGVVLHGTGRKAILEGYSAAGKTGTAQKLDPATGTYSRTKYVASFAGFAPINNPAITVAVILDSAAGPHQGGQIAAPVFQRVTQQVLEYLHAPHDVELPPNRQVLLAERKATDDDLAESSPDHLGASLEVAETAASDPSPTPTAAKPSPATQRSMVVAASLREKESGPMPVPVAANSKTASAPDSKQPTGTVVLEVEQGGIEVPSFLGKTVRAAIEAAEDSGLELEVVGSGIARDQTPTQGSHVAAGSRIVVHFER